MAVDGDAVPDLTQRMLPVLDDANRPYWTGGRDGLLILQHCDDCGTWVHPPEPAPHACGGSLTLTAVSGRASVWSFTINRHAWNPAVPPPYVVALVEPDDAPGVRIITNVVGCPPEDVRVGMPVQVVFEEHGEVFLPLFEPLLESRAVTGRVGAPPATGRPHGSVADAVAAIGGIEVELFFEGTATQFCLAGRRGDDYPTDGRWAVEPRDTAEFRSRMVIVRPGDAAQFNGTVLVSWNNVAGESFVTGPAAVRLLRAGFALVGVTAQRSGIDGAPGSSALPDDTDVDVSIPSWGGLRGEDPERYGSLVHPGDAFSFDIFTHAAELIGRSRPTESDPLDGLDVQHLIAMGGSQSASRLATYVNAVQPLGRTFDAFLLQIYAGVPCALDPGSAPPTLPEFGVNTVELLPWRTHHIREDLDVPVIVLNSEFEAEKCHPNHQPDTALVRWWEVAGTAHLGLMGAAEAEGLAAVMPDVCLVSFAPANFAAISALQRWLSGGGPPPHQPRLDKVGDPPALPRDEHGNATGGIRWPEVVAPVGTHVGESPPGFVQLLGHSTPFSDDVIRARYGDRATWLRLYAEAVERLVESQVVLPEDAAEMLARASSRPLPL